MKTKLRIHKLNDYSRGIIITDWINAHEIVNDTIYTEVEAEISANQIVLSLQPPVNARSASQSNNELCPTGSNTGELERPDDEKLGGRNHWSNLTVEELKAKYPDFPTGMEGKVELLGRVTKDLVKTIDYLNRKVGCIDTAVEVLQTIQESKSKKGESQ